MGFRLSVSGWPRLLFLRLIRKGRVASSFVSVRQGLRVLSAGGDLVLRLHSVFTRATASLLQLVAVAFSSVGLFRPPSAPAWKTEAFFLGRGRREEETAAAVGSLLCAAWDVLSAANAHAREGAKAGAERSCSEQGGASSSSRTEAQPGLPNSSWSLSQCLSAKLFTTLPVAACVAPQRDEPQTSLLSPARRSLSSLWGVRAASVRGGAYSHRWISDFNNAVLAWQVRELQKTLELMCFASSAQAADAAGAARRKAIEAALNLEVETETRRAEAAVFLHKHKLLGETWPARSCEYCVSLLPLLLLIRQSPPRWAQSDADGRALVGLQICWFADLLPSMHSPPLPQSEMVESKRSTANGEVVFLKTSRPLRSSPEQSPRTQS